MLSKQLLEKKIMHFCISIRITYFMGYASICMTCYVTFSYLLYKYRCFIQSTYIYSLFMCVFVCVCICMWSWFFSREYVLNWVQSKFSLKKLITLSICGYIYTTWYGLRITELNCRKKQKENTHAEVWVIKLLLTYRVYVILFDT